jgi:hypothetical protein
MLHIQYVDLQTVSFAVLNRVLYYCLFPNLMLPRLRTTLKLHSSYFLCWGTSLKLTIHIDYTNRLLFQGSTAPREPRSPLRVSANTLRHSTFEWPLRRRSLYLVTHNIHKKQSGIPPSRFEPAIPGSELPQSHALDRAATEFGNPNI